jgi:hypothetical protein
VTEESERDVVEMVQSPGAMDVTADETPSEIPEEHHIVTAIQVPAPPHVHGHGHGHGHPQPHTHVPSHTVVEKPAEPSTQSNPSSSDSSENDEDESDTEGDDGEDDEDDDEDDEEVNTHTCRGRASLLITSAG